MKQVSQWLVLSVLTLMALPNVAHADLLSGNGDVNTFKDLIETALTFLQALFMLGGVIYLMRSGYRISQARQEGWDEAKNAVLGMAIVAGAIIIAQFVKSNITA